MNSCHIFGPEGRFAVIVLALCRAVAACLGRGSMSVEMIGLVWRRVRRVESLMQALVERVRTGRYRALVRQAGSGCGVRGAGDGSALRLPRGFAWLIRLVGYPAAGYASQLSVVLAEPEMVALLRDVPQARRIMRPLCRMLGLTLPVAVADGSGVAPLRAEARGAVGDEVRDEKRAGVIAVEDGGQVEARRLVLRETPEVPEYRENGLIVGRKLRPA